jgi:uncharacterized protein YbjT (DUF2867 family)
MNDLATITVRIQADYTMSKILLVGATGYVGGTVLSRLLQNTSSSLKELLIHLHVRREDQAHELMERAG